MDEILGLARPEILAMKPYSSARKEGEQAAMTIFLDANENPFPAYPGGERCRGLNRYPEPQPDHLLSLFANHYGVRREELLITRGADEAIDLLVRAFCTAGRDSVLINPPTFGMYEIAAQTQNASVHSVPLRSHAGFQLDVERVLSTCHEHHGLKLVFVCTPNNPTGNVMRRVDVLSLCSRLLGRALVVADETYVEFSRRPSLGWIRHAHPNLVVLRTLSKEYSLAGERCGVTIAHPDVIGLAGRILAPYPLATSSIRAVAEAMSPRGVEQARVNMRVVIEQRDHVAETLARSAGVIRIHASDANFLLVEVPEPRLLMEMMEDSGIKIRDRSSVRGIERCVRISIGTPDQNQLMLEVFDRYAEQCQRVAGILR
jgi:histidinol-phosphate aminotransferase